MSAARRVEVLVVSPGRGVRLAMVDGRPVVRVEVVEDAATTLAALDAWVQGPAGRSPRASRSKVREPAWREHRITDGVAGRAPGVEVEDGRVVVDLPAGVELAVFRRELLGRLDALAGAGAVDAGVVARERLRQPHGATVARSRRSERSRVGGVDAPTSHLLDVGREPWLLYWTAVAARLAAIAEEAP